MLLADGVATWGKPVRGDCSAVPLTSFTATCNNYFTKLMTMIRMITAVTENNVAALVILISPYH